MCHNVPLDNVKIEFEIGRDKVVVTATAVATYKTGVEMEALVAVSVASLTIYDMLKAVDKSMVIGEICLLKKKEEKAEFTRGCNMAKVVAVNISEKKEQSNTQSKRSK